MAEVSIDLSKYKNITSACARVRSVLNKVIKTIHGDYGVGDARKKALGTDYSIVQGIINYLYKEGGLNLK